MTLRHKLLLAFVVVLLLMVAQAGMAVVLLTRVAEESAALVRPTLDRVDIITHLEADLLQLHTLEHSLVVSSSATVREQSEIEIVSIQEAIHRRIAAYAALPLDDVRAVAIAQIAERYEKYLTSQQVIAHAAGRGDSDEALWEYLRRQSQFQALDAEIHRLRHEEYRATENMQERMVEFATWARWPLGFIVILVVAVELAVGWYVSESIIRGLATLEAGARRIARERFGERVARPPEPELAALADTLNSVMEDLATSKTERLLLEQERLRLLRERLNQTVRAQEDERARVSRELHDQAGQALTALKYGLARVQQRGDARMEAEVQGLITLAGEAARQISALARDLRPAVLDDLGLVPALRSYARDLSERIDIQIQFSARGSIPRLSSDAETTIFRVVQEALTNVAKHAHAQHAWVELAVEDAQLAVRVRDDGRSG